MHFMYNKNACVTFTVCQFNGDKSPYLVKTGHYGFFSFLSFMMVRVVENYPFTNLAKKS